MALGSGLSFIFDASKDETPETLARKRALAAAIMGNIGQRQARNAGEGIGNALASIGQGIQVNVLNRRADAAARAGQDSAASAWNPFVASLGGQQFPPAPGASSDTASATPTTDYPSHRVAQAFGDSTSPANWENIKRGIFKGESGGDYDALFGFSNRPGGQFGNTKLTNMTVDQALAFSDPRGPYGSWVKGQIGRVATPMGAYQVVGTTLKAAKNGLGLTGNEPMTPELQDRIGQWILANQGTGAWAGYKGPIAGSPAVAANDAMASGQPIPPAPVQVASLDPSAGLPDVAPVPMPSPGPSNIPIADGKGDRVANLMTRPVMMQPGPMAAGDTQSAFVDRMTSPQSMTGGTPMPMQGTPASATQQAPQPVQVAQAQPAGPDLSRIPVTAGGNAGVYQPGQGPSLQMLMQAASNPWLNDSQKAVINMMLKQKMDPNAALDAEYRRAQIDYMKRRGGSLINAGNGNIYDPQTGSWISAPAEQGDAPLFDGKSVQAQGLNYLVRTGELTKEQAAQLAAGKTITDPSTGAITFMTPQGLVTQPGNSGGNGDGRNTLTNPKKPTDTEYVTGTYADRMTNSGKIIEGLESEGTSLKDNFLNGLPLGNYMVSGDYQKFDQAQRDFINAVLRRESGAVISDEEFANARKQYLPQPGDTPEVLDQKRQNRQIAIEGMRRAAGPSYNDGQPAAPSPQGGGGQKRLKFNPATGELE